MPSSKKGKGSVAGIPGTWDVILYPLAQSIKITHSVDLQVTKDNIGDDASWRANNEKLDGDWAMKLLGDTNAHAKAGAAFLTPLATITASGFDVTVMNTTWSYMGDGSIDLKNDDVGDITVKVRRYVDATQNSAFATTPS